MSVYVCHECTKERLTKVGRCDCGSELLIAVEKECDADCRCCPLR